jgi:hypothetical protein
MTIWTLASSRIAAEIHPIGAMLAPVVFSLPGGRKLQPFKIAPWSERTEAAALPPVMRYLRGDFACVPFGAPAPPPSALDPWRQLWTDEPSFQEVHGPSANAEWSLVGASPTSLTAALDYPDVHPVRRVERSVRLDDDNLAVDIDLTIHARRAVRLAVGVHPVLDVGDVSEDTELEIPFRFGRTFPGDYAPGTSRLARDARFTDLEQVPLLTGEHLSLRNHPLREAAEEVVQLCGTDGVARLRRRSLGVAVELRWRSEHFPSVVLGIANAGRSGPPFDGRWRALYVEPVASAFGLGATIGANPDNPIAREGVATAIDLTPGKPWSTRYRVGVTTF